MTLNREPQPFQQLMDDAYFSCRPDQEGFPHGLRKPSHTASSTPRPHHKITQRTHNRQHVRCLHRAHRGRDRRWLRPNLLLPRRVVGHEQVRMAEQPKPPIWRVGDARRLTRPQLSPRTTRRHTHMKPTCKAEARLGYNFADLHMSAKVITFRDAYWAETKPWRVVSRTSGKFLQRVASKARRQSARTTLRDELRDL